MKIIVIIAGTTRILFRYQFFDKEGIIVMIWKPTKEVEQVVQESEGLWVDSQALLVARPCKFPWPRYWNPKLLLVNMLAYARQPLPLVFECVHEKVNVTSVAEQFERSVDWKKFYRDLSSFLLSVKRQLFCFVFINWRKQHLLSACVLYSSMCCLHDESRTSYCFSKSAP